MWLEQQVKQRESEAVEQRALVSQLQRALEQAQSEVEVAVRAREREAREA